MHVVRMSGRLRSHCQLVGGDRKQHRQVLSAWMRRVSVPHWHGQEGKSGRRQRFLPNSCCDRTCGLLECSPGYGRKDDAASIVASTSEACCQKTCSTFRCPHGHINKGRGIIGDSYDECCVKTCKAVQCPRGHTLIEDHNIVITVSSESCCEPTCAAYTSPPCGVPFKRRRGETAKQQIDASGAAASTAAAQAGMSRQQPIVAAGSAADVAAATTGLSTAEQPVQAGAAADNKGQVFTQHQRSKPLLLGPRRLLEEVSRA